MKSQLYSIFDTASGVYDRPIFAAADGIVMREFSDCCQNAEHQYGQHPEDYTLIRLGNFDNTTGKLIDEQNESLATGLELVAASRNVRNDNEEKLRKENPEAFTVTHAGNNATDGMKI